MRMKCGCLANWKQIDIWGNEQPCCPIHDTYDTDGKNKNDILYNDEAILTNKEYDVINEKYIKKQKNMCNVVQKNLNTCRHCFLQDNDGHWYCIPVDKKENFYHWVNEVENDFVFGDNFDDYRLSKHISKYSFENLKGADDK